MALNAERPVAGNNDFFGGHRVPRWNSPVGFMPSLQQILRPVHGGKDTFKVSVPKDDASRMYMFG
jgi:hypothetical protein